MKTRTLSAMLMLVFITACNGTFQVGIDYTPAGSPTATLVAPSNLPQSTATPIAPTVTPALPTDTAVQPIDTAVPPTDTAVVSSDVTPGPQMLQMFLIAVGDNGQSGDMLGCGDSLVPVQIEVPPSQGVLRASYGALLALKDQFYGQSGLYNALYQSDLQIDSVTVSGGKAVIQLTGTLTLAGECDNPRVAAQLEATARQFPTVTDVTIYINGKLLAEALSLKG
jgi:Sporulation and spore germination